MKRYILLGSICLIFILILFFNISATTLSYDIVIKDGFIINGSGNPWFKSDIGIVGSKIVKIGLIDPKYGKKVIVAKGLIVAPGFIDVHTHCDRDVLRIPTVDNYMLQGVTTVIGGNCGGHPFPLNELLEQIKSNGISLNFGCLIGHNTIRREVMGFKMEPPTETELEQMKSLIDQEMKAGGFGLSTGLAYLPGIYSNTDELVELASVIAQYGGIYTSHIRDQGDHITEAIEEAILVGEKNGIPVEISHIKLAKDSVWGKLKKITRPVEDARSRGVEVFLDQYPYTATSSGFASSFPSWAFEGGREKFLERLKDKDTYNKIKKYVIQKRLTSTKKINTLKTIYIAYCKKNSEYQGKNLNKILKEQGKKPTVSNAADLIISIEKNGGAQGVFFQMDEKDVEHLMKLPYTMHASDGGIQEIGKGVPHPRSYGTFSRVIGHYVREKGILSIEEAIRKMTSLPAQVFRLENRGLIKEGMYADIVIFHMKEFKDKATFSMPHQYSKGLEYVFVNGEIVVENNRHTGRKPGMVLYGPGKTLEKEN